MAMPTVVAGVTSIPIGIGDVVFDTGRMEARGRKPGRKPQ